MNRLSKLAVNPEGFIFDPCGGEMFTVNKTGLRILNGLREQKSTGLIVNELLRVFDATKEQIEKDIMDFKSQLRVFHLL